MSSSQHLLVIGGNGGIGRQCIEQGLLAGYRVTAVLRTPSKLTLSHPDLDIVQGDVTKPATILKHLAHKNAIISAIGTGGSFGNDHPTTLYSQGAATILAEMKKTTARRVFFISSSAIEVNPLNSWFVRIVTQYVVARLLKHMFNDLRTLEAVVKTSDLDWTIIRPPRLTNEASRGQYRYAINEFLPHCLTIARADVAHFIVNHLTDSTTFRTTLEIAY